MTEAEKKEIAAGHGPPGPGGRGAESRPTRRGKRPASPWRRRSPPCRRKSARLQKLIDELRQEQKKVNAELDKQIAALASDLAKSNEKTREAEARQKLQFKDLGEKLAAAQGVAPDIAREMAAVLNARTEMQGVQSLIGGLERQKDEGQASAYKKMRAILIAAVILVAALVVALFLLLAPKKEADALRSAAGGKGGSGAATGPDRRPAGEEAQRAGRRGKGRQLAPAEPAT